MDGGTADQPKAALQRRVTVKDLARDLGMSVSTVSAPSIPDAVVAADTRKAVLQRASEIDIAPILSQSLITKKTQIVGMVVSDLTNPFYPELMTRLTALLQQAGMNLMLAAAEQPEKIDEAVELLLTYQPDLMIVLATNSIPMRARNARPPARPSSSSTAFRRTGWASASLRQCRRREAGGGPSDRPRAPEPRLCVGLPGRLDQCGAPAGLLRKDGRAWPRGARGSSRPHVLLRSRLSGRPGDWRHAPRPDGVLCANDIVAIGFIAALREGLGSTCPATSRWSVMTISPWQGWPSHKLTTIAQPLDAMMTATVALARELSCARAGSAAHPALRAGPLVERSTVRDRRGGGGGRVISIANGGKSGSEA